MVDRAAEAVPAAAVSRTGAAAVPETEGAAGMATNAEGSVTSAEDAEGVEDVEAVGVGARRTNHTRTHRRSTPIRSNDALKKCSQHWPQKRQIRNRGRPNHPQTIPGKHKQWSMTVVLVFTNARLRWRGTVMDTNLENRMKTDNVRVKVKIDIYPNG
jgi:hypothetical protein